MGRNQVILGVDGQDDFEQVARVEPQNGPAIGADVADFFQRSLYFFNRRQRGRKNNVVDFAGALKFFVDAADLAGQHKTDGGVAGGRNFLLDSAGQVGLQFKQALFGGGQLVAHFLQPAGVGNIAGADHLHAFELRPAAELLKIEIFAGGARIVGMNMQIGDDFHWLLPARLIQRAY